MRFGAWIRGHRLRRNLSMDRVCQTVELSKAYLSLIETGQKGPPKDKFVCQMAKALELDERDLLLRAHRERYPEDVLGLRALLGEMREILEAIRSQGRKASAKGRNGNGRGRKGESSATERVQALSEAVGRLERLVPMEPAGGDELLKEIDDLRAEEREVALAVIREIKRLRPRRGPQSNENQ